MKETKPYWYHNTAYSMEPYFVRLDFPNLLKDLSALVILIQGAQFFPIILRT